MDEYIICNGNKSDFSIKFNWGTEQGKYMEGNKIQSDFQSNWRGWGHIHTHNADRWQKPLVIAFSFLINRNYFCPLILRVSQYSVIELNL